MDFATPTDPLLRFALICGIAVFLMTLVLLLSIAVLRVLLTLRKRHEGRLNELWQPIFLHAIEDLPCEIPVVLGRDREVVLVLWIEMIESIRGIARDRLSALAMKLKFDQTAHKLLLRRSLRAQLIGITVLGRLHDKNSWGELEGKLKSPNSLLSLVSAHALLQIDPIRALPPVFAQVARHDDWPLSKVASMLAELRTTALATTLRISLSRAGASGTPRLLMLLGVIQVDQPWLLLEPFLAPDQPVPILIAALKICRDPQASAAVRELVQHESWAVRAQAAAALGRIGVAEDAGLLGKLLLDREWWVRYRAALALTQLPFVSRAALNSLCELSGDPFAAQIMRQALAETAKAPA